MVPQLLTDLNKKLGQHFRPRSLDSLVSPAGVRRVLSRERSRCERSGRVFCCVLFRLDAGTRKALEELAAIVGQRVRQSDELGFFDSETITAILPDTDEHGAHCFATDVLSETRKREGLAPIVSIYVYPAGPPDGSQKKHISRRKEQMLVQRPRIVESLGRANRRRIATHPWETSAMDHLFVTRLPWWKRTLDFAGACLGLIVTSPILLATALAVKLSSQGPIIFVQRRAGLGGRPFHIYKFRSMYVDAEGRKAELRHLNEQDGPAFKIKNDPRITRVGRILRRTSLDELPQLFNVLKGDMSFVGPRPPTFDEVEQYSTWYRRRLDVTPGITCIWQISGRSQVSFEDWMRMDIQYIRRLGLWQDIRLLLGTLPAVILRRGAC